jgi:hypothetical protein
LCSNIKSSIENDKLFYCRLYQNNLIVSQLFFLSIPAFSCSSGIIHRREAKCAEEKEQIQNIQHLIEEFRQMTNDRRQKREWLKARRPKALR